MSQPLTETSKTFAERIGCSKGLVSQYAAEGMPRADAGDVLVVDALRWIAANKPNSKTAPRVPELLAALGAADEPTSTKAEKPPQASAAPRGLPEVADRGGQGPDDDIDAGSLTEAKRLHELLKAKRTRLALETDIGGRVLKSAVEGVIYKSSRRFRSALLGFEDRHGPSMCAELGIDPAVGCPIIGKFMRIVAVELSEERPGAEGDDDA